MSLCVNVCMWRLSINSTGTASTTIDQTLGLIMARALASIIAHFIICSIFYTYVFVYVCGGGQAHFCDTLKCAQFAKETIYIYVLVSIVFDVSTSNRMDMAINVTKMPLNRPNRSPSSKKYINETDGKKQEQEQEEEHRNNNNSVILHRIDRARLSEHLSSG